MSVPDYEKLASKLRKKSRTTRPAYDVEAIAKDLVIDIKYFSANGDKVLADVKGAYCADDKVIYVNHECSLYKQRLIIAHGIGHYALEHDSVVCAGYDANKKACEAADEFAHALLMPEKDFMLAYPLFKSSIDSLSKLFRVSSKEIAFKAYKLLD